MFSTPAATQDNEAVSLAKLPFDFTGSGNQYKMIYKMDQNGMY